jgi:hypothetical protein
MRRMCTLSTSKATDIDENIANQNHATRTRTPKPGYLKLTNVSVLPKFYDTYNNLGTVYHDTGELEKASKGYHQQNYHHPCARLCWQPIQNKKII